MILHFQNKTFKFRPKEKRFSPDFWKGLSFAVVFHVALLLFFKVHFSSHPDDGCVLPFTEATADASVSKKEIYSTSASFPFLDEDIPEYPKLKESCVRIDPLFLSDPDFSSLEKLPYD